MRRKRANERPREKRTLIPAFDPAELAKEIEAESSRITAAPPFDPSSYARIVDEPLSSGHLRAAAPVALEEDASLTPPVPFVGATAQDPTLDASDVETIGREMYGCYLASDFPEALVLAERVLEHQPSHTLAQLVARQCRERLQPTRTLSPESVLRLRTDELERHRRDLDPTSSFVLGHVDGVSSAATVAALTGLPRPEALARLHALLDLGVVEVVA